jgi:hypothetical protein
VFNATQVMDAFLGYAAVRGVDYAPLDNPTRMVWGRGWEIALDCSRSRSPRARRRPVGLWPEQGVAFSQLAAAAPLPQRQSIVWATPRKDASEQSVDLRKAEIFINNRGITQSEAKGGGGAAPFCCFELYR